MPRAPRIEFEGAVYHVMARGNRLQEIFVDDEDRETFLRTLGEMCQRSGLQIYAWVLMGNHYHLALQTPQGNLVEGIGWLQNTYTRRFNTRHRGWGRLFGDRYKSVLVDADDESGYLPSLIDYIHLNPARAKIVSAKDGGSILDFPWSSLPRCYALPPSKRPRWMAHEEGLSIQDTSDTARGRRGLIARLDDRMRGEEADDCGLAEIEGQSLQSTLRRGWYWGRQEFREAMLELLSKSGINPASNTNYAASSLAHDSDEALAAEIVERGLAHFGIGGGTEGLLALGRGDIRRRAIAWALCRKTSLRQKRVAEIVGYRTAGNVSQQARLFESGSGGRQEERWRKSLMLD